RNTAPATTIAQIRNVARTNPITFTAITVSACEGIRIPSFLQLLSLYQIPAGKATAVSALPRPGGPPLPGGRGGGPLPSRASYIRYIYAARTPRLADIQPFLFHQHRQHRRPVRAGDFQRRGEKE